MLLASVVLLAGCAKTEVAEDAVAPTTEEVVVPAIEVAPTVEVAPAVEVVPAAEVATGA